MSGLEANAITSQSSVAIDKRSVLRVPVRFLSDAQREQLSGFPAELGAEAMDRFFTLSDADLAEVRRRHGDSNRLGWALQLCGLRMLGFCPEDMTTVPAVAVRFWPVSSTSTPAVWAATGCAPRW